MSMSVDKAQMHLPLLLVGQEIVLTLNALHAQCEKIDDKKTIVYSRVNLYKLFNSHSLFVSFSSKIRHDMKRIYF